MSPVRPTFTEYGGGGDVPGAMRVRRAFQFTVLAVVLFTAALYIAEQYGRYDRAEALYRNGLTKHPESGRVELRAAVRTMEQRGELPPSKYLQALAEREEADLVIPTYRRAYEIDPANPELAIRYGAALFQDDEYIAARERFRDAVLNAPNNALPQYLEAAALAMSASNLEDFNEAMAMVVRTNASNLAVNLPRVLWFHTLPRNSRAFSDWLRNTADECAAPLYQMTEKVIELAPQIAEEQGFEQADVSLQAMQNMGKALIRADDRTTPLAVAGLTIHVQCAAERERLAELEGLRPNEDAMRQRVQAQAALDRILEFEANRGERLEQYEARVSFPLWRAIQALSLAIGVYTVVLLLSHSLGGGVVATLFKFVAMSAAVLFTGFLALLPFSLTTGSARNYWPLPLRREAVGIVLGGAVLMFILLMAFTGTMRAPATGNEWMGAAEAGWVSLILLVCAFAVLYPGMALPKAATVADRYTGSEGEESTIHVARRHRRRAWAILARRYTGLFAGVTWILVCVWFIAFRVMTSTFPIQFVLVTPGLRDEEAAVIDAALRMLN